MDVDEDQISYTVHPDLSVCHNPLWEPVSSLAMPFLYLSDTHPTRPLSPSPFQKPPWRPSSQKLFYPPLNTHCFCLWPLARTIITAHYSNSLYTQANLLCLLTNLSFLKDSSIYGLIYPGPYQLKDSAQKGCPGNMNKEKQSFCRIILLRIIGWNT